MKTVFSTRNVLRKSFSDLCHIAYDYQCAGFEIYDALKEQKEHTDSILRSDRTFIAKQKLMNKHLSVSALCFPYPAESRDVSSEDLLRYILLASSAEIQTVIITVMTDTDTDILAKKLDPAVKTAEEHGIEILLETKGYLSDTSHLLEIINRISSVCLGASWDVRETYFNAGETAEKTIETLGAYIRYVRLGDKKDGENVLIGEGDLPVSDFLSALHSLNYESYVSVEWNDGITDADIILTHFVNYISSIGRTQRKDKKCYYNRAETGTFPLKKYEITDKTFSQILDITADKYPDQYAFKYTTLDYTRTYSQFRRDVDKVAAALIASGVKKGHHVAVWATNIPEWFLTFWATVKIGAVLVTVNTAYRINEIEYLLRQSDTHTLFMIENCKDINYGKIISELCPELNTLPKGKPLYSKKLPFLRNVITIGFSMNGCLTWREFMNRSELVPYDEVVYAASTVKPSDVANMQYTSGTTGFPKGVMLTHSNIINNGKIIGDRMDLSTADRMMIQVPMFHCFGMVLSMMSIMTHAGTLCPLPYFSPKSSLACINEEKITCFNGVPTMFIAMFSHPDFAKTDFSYMRTGIMAGANCPPDLMKKAADEMNMKEIISVYGQTEASPGCTMGEVNESLELRTETVGSAFPGIECKIIDPETGKRLPDGESGEFVVRGFNVMKGYYKMPEATRKAIDEKGWLHSGDICMRTPDGYYKVTGRLKDMIIRGGENIYPREIEEFYLTHEKVEDVQVIGVKDDKYGEEACCWVILKKGQTASEDELRQFGLDRMATHKVPRYFIFTEKFPLNAAGKVLKYKMREESEKIIKNY